LKPETLESKVARYSEESLEVPDANQSLTILATAKSFPILEAEEDDI
jgi:hypothetical protein